MHLNREVFLKKIARKKPYKNYLKDVANTTRGNLNFF
jgi:hypothetical protein